MSRNLPIAVPRGSLALSREERALVKHAKALQRRANAVRAEDAARRYVTSGRMQDIGDLTEDALAIGGDIGDRLAVEVSARPFFARELADIASTGTHGLKAELRSYIQECH
jgi:hypothetical protein